MAKSRPIVAAVLLEKEPQHLPDTVTCLREAEVPVVVICNSPPENREEAHDLISDLKVEAVEAAGGSSRGEARNLIAGSKIVKLHGLMDLEPIVYHTNNGTRLLSADLSNTLQTAFRDPRVGIVGGLIYQASDTGKPIQQVQHNHGPVIDSVPHMLSTYGTAAILKAIGMMPKVQAERWRSRLGFMLAAWPDIYDSEPMPRPVGWVHEGSLAIGAFSSKPFPPLNVHETHVLASDARSRGLVTLFEPRIQSRLMTDEVITGVRPESFEGIATAVIIARDIASRRRRARADYNKYLLSDPLER